MSNLTNRIGLPLLMAVFMLFSFQGEMYGKKKHRSQRKSTTISSYSRPNLRNGGKTIQIQHWGFLDGYEIKMKPDGTAIFDYYTASSKDYGSPDKSIRGTWNESRGSDKDGYSFVYILLNFQGKNFYYRCDAISRVYKNPTDMYKGENGEYVKRYVCD